MKDLSKKQAAELTRKLLRSTSAEEILELSKQLGMSFNEKSANEFAQESLEIAALNESVQK